MTPVNSPSSSTPAPVYLNKPDVRRATGVRAGDMDLIKSLSRQILPEIKPGKRMEYIARAFGFRSAIALRTAVTAATDEDFFLVPSQEPFDDFRKGVMEQVLADGTLEQEDCDRLTQCAPLVVAGLEMSRGTLDTIAQPHPEGTAYRKPGIAELQAHQKASGAGQGTMASGYWGPFFLDLVLPDLRWAEFGAERFTQGGAFDQKHTLWEGEDYVEVVSVSQGSPSRAEIQKMGAKWAEGNIRQRTFAEAPGYLDEPQFDRHEAAFTLLSRTSRGDVKAFMTVRFEISHAATDDMIRVHEVLKKGEYDEVTDAELEHFRATNWFVGITFSGYGVPGGGDGLDELDALKQAMFCYYSILFDTVGEAANRSDSSIHIEVLPIEGKAFGLVTFEQMLPGLRGCIEDHQTGEFYVDDPDGDDFSIEMLEP